MKAFRLWTALSIAVFVVTPIVAYIYAWTARTMWLWFAKPQYGSGPTMASWFAIFVIGDLMLTRVKKADSDVDSPILGVLFLVVEAIVVALFTLLAGAVVHSWFGWGA